MNKNDKEIRELLDVVGQKIASLEKKKREPLSTNGVFKYRDGTHFNINVAKQDQIIDAMTLVVGKEATHEDACRRLGVNIDFQWNGYSAFDWETDFRNRIAALQYDEKRKAITNAKSKLNSLVSSEGKTAIFSVWKTSEKTID